LFGNFSRSSHLWRIPYSSYANTNTLLLIYTTTKLNTPKETWCKTKPSINCHLPSIYNNRIQHQLMDCIQHLHTSFIPPPKGARASHQHRMRYHHTWDKETLMGSLYHQPTRYIGCDAMWHRDHKKSSSLHHPPSPHTSTPPSQYPPLSHTC
jgi:hypothetical protein